jgi:hypothetical protein
MIDPNIAYNNVYNNEFGNYSGIDYTGDPIDKTGINGNISEDSCFVNTGHWVDNNTPLDTNDDYWIIGDYRIGYFSPCRDSGDPNIALSIDLIDKPRPAFNNIDIGTYELQIHDLTATGTVDYTDIRLLAENWLDVNNLILEDVDDSNNINWIDFSILSSDWLK